MAPSLVKQVTHRPGPFKQSNKPHKGSHSKREKNGRQDVKAITRKISKLSKRERKNQLNQIRKNKRDENLKIKRNLCGLQAPPLIVTILPLDDSINVAKFMSDLKSCDEELITSEGSLQFSHICSTRLKQRFTFLTPSKFDLHSVVDALKVSEILLLLHTDNSLDDYTDNLLSIIMAHALPTPVHVVQDIGKLNPKKKSEYKKKVLKNIESRFPDAKLLHADNDQEMQLLLRQISGQKQLDISFRDKRFHLLAENVVFGSSSEGKGILQVSGYVRGQPLNVNQLIHIPGWGTFQMSQVDHKCDPLDTQAKRKILSDVEVCLTETPDVHLQESLQSEVIPDPMEGEQTWPTQEELDEADFQPKKTIIKVRKGTSEYQAAWIMDNEEDESADESDSDIEHMEDKMEEEEEAEIEMDDSESISNIDDENYDKTINVDEEKERMIRFKEERMNLMFPDEEDTPLDVLARIRYQKYRGLKNFAFSPWDPMENLPLDYARIYRFQNFNHTKKKVMKSEKEGVKVGQYVTIHIKDVPQSIYDNFLEKNNTLVAYGLLPHEQKMSVMNVIIRKHPTCSTPVKSKDTLIFHIGFSRFTCQPIFSEHKLGNKFKLERYLPSDITVVASFFAPVVFPPAPVVVFRKQLDGSHELVATGSILDVNPNRVIVKRIVLSGYPSRIYKKSAVVKYLFFNKEDINWFKSIELQTKCGLRGHIKESIGTHGHVKCVFEKQLQSQDVVLMLLYKRLFPKWTYDSYVPDPVHSSTTEKEDALELML